MIDIPTLILQCGIVVHPETAAAIIRHESSGNPYALNTQVRSYYPETRERAEQLLHEALRAGRSTDIGLMQVNSQWLRRYRLRPTDLLDPCTNIRVGTDILSKNYASTWAKYRAEAPALLAALSLYNTGHERRGITNGYVSKVVRNSGVSMTAIEGSRQSTKAQPLRRSTSEVQAARSSYSRTGPTATKMPSR